MKIGICTDSGSGITPEEGKRLGITVVPMPFRMGEEEYFEDINMSREEFFRRLLAGELVSTSQPAMKSVLEAVSVTQRMHCVFAKMLGEKGYNGRVIQDILNRAPAENGIYIGVQNLSYLKRGGRITPVAATIGTLLQIKPVLAINEGGKLDSYKKVRTERQVREAIIEGLHQTLERLGDPEAGQCHIAVAYTDNREQAESFREQLMAEFPKRYDPEIVVNPLSLLISCHIGENGLGAAVIKRPKELED